MDGMLAAIPLLTGETEYEFCIFSSFRPSSSSLQRSYTASKTIKFAFVNIRKALAMVGTLGSSASAPTIEDWTLLTPKSSEEVASVGMQRPNSNGSTTYWSTSCSISISDNAVRYGISGMDNADSAQTAVPRAVIVLFL